MTAISLALTWSFMWIVLGSIRVYQLRHCTSCDPCPNDHYYEIGGNILIMLAGGIIALVTAVVLAL